MNDFNTWPDFWNENLEKEFAEIALKKYPEEVLCFVTSNGKLLELPNLSKTPEDDFLCAATPEVIAASVGIIHTHPDADVRPSELDCITQIQLDFPSGIMSVSSDSTSESCWFGDHLLNKPLIGRPFLHVVYDCYSLIRAYFWQTRGVLLNDYPREDDWWNSGEDLYESNFKKEGFVEVDTSKGIEPGYCFLMKVHSRVVNHAAIYLGDNKILHHLHGRLSRVDNYSSWAKIVDKVVRLPVD